MSFLGRLAYQSYYRPLARWKKCQDAGGLWEEHLTELGRRRMEQAAWKIRSQTYPEDPAARLHLLTGSKYWYQALFCLVSWTKACEKAPKIFLYDDGTLEPRQLAKIEENFPSLEVADAPEILNRLDQSLPVTRYPFLRAHRLIYPHLRKITDVHAGRPNWSLVLDSDLLFFRKPEFVLNWLAAPDRPFHAVDCAESYGYARSVLKEFVGQEVPTLVNVGLCGLHGGKIDWDRLESWAKSLVAAHGSSYYLEQALVAMLVAGKDRAVAPAGDYVTLPSPAEATAPSAVMHHYVAESKKWYFRANWEGFATNAL